jgi:putative DNA primase/helicase
MKEEIETPQLNLEQIEKEANLTTEEIEEMVGDENGESYFEEYKGKKFKVTRDPPRYWSCKRCGNRYSKPSYMCECHSREFEFSYKDEEDLIDFYCFNKEFFAMDVDFLFAKNNKKMITELITKAIEKQNYIYTTRDDKNAEYWIYKDGIYLPQGKTYIKEYARDVLKDNYKKQWSNEIVEKVEADTYIEQEEFFNNNIVEEIAVENGILNIFTRELSNFTPSKVFFNKLPVEYSPNQECPEIEKHFKVVLKNEEDAVVMFELFGYLLLKENRFEKAFIFVGDGSNGKTVSVSLKKRFLGTDNITNISLQRLEKDDFSISELFGKMANLCGELGNKDLRNPHNFKELTSQDEVSAKRKFLKDIKFVNYAKMVFACNELPKTYDTKDGFWRRWVLFEFPYSFKSEKEKQHMLEKGKDVSKIKLKDNNIVKKITTKEELSGLLNKALDSLDSIIKNKDFSSSKGVDEIKNMWIRKSDSFLAFCLDNIEEEYDCRIDKSELRNEYRKYCKLHRVNGAKDKPMKDSLEENYGVGEIKVDNNWHWEGIKFKKGKLNEFLTYKVSTFKKVENID